MTERQKQIIAAAISLFLTEGVSVPTARIAKAAGVSNGTLFNAFATKQDLIDAIYRKTKSDMLAVWPNPAGRNLDRAMMRANWDAYLGWARHAPDDHRVMHLLKDSGLASPQVKSEVDAQAAPYGAPLLEAFETGAIRGPSVNFISDLIFTQIDLVIAHNLTGAGEDLAFDMLCNTIGLD
ncbi:TetR/AcrR family transcriptional regulator [Loktanella sp. IMCC34160]|uniref:TetR/AcrR family transcriptional regulator n=1 Tax=Loktanella sp. IMCC34160 TaxID=2510646 RepID=UPI00101BCE07|nr:TetR/AcrR family transcriptional regulator [Loktanella sp. IMCC34160]RYG89421.1 TetR/AcrR family transcriptional regulator [Loktanella sp. IMCC34160]